MTELWDEKSSCCFLFPLSKAPSDPRLSLGVARSNHPHSTDEHTEAERVQG